MSSYQIRSYDAAYSVLELLRRCLLLRWSRLLLDWGPWCLGGYRPAPLQALINDV